MKTIYILIILGLLAALITGCDVKQGEMVSGLDIPVDYTLDLYGENEGLYPDTNVLNDPNNPYRYASINMENVWDLNDECPSAKAKFYLWATMLARIPTGEYQYFTAFSLHELYTEGGSLNAKEQAKRAYRSVLDHFFGSVTWWLADWLNDETYYSVLLRNRVGMLLYDPSDEGLLPLYNDPAQALADLSEWGYHYDQETGVLTRIE
jgi:hypothetical protein